MIRHPIRCEFLLGGRRPDHRGAAGPARRRRGLGPRCRAAARSAARPGEAAAARRPGGGTAWRRRRRQRPAPGFGRGRRGAGFPRTRGGAGGRAERRRDRQERALRPAGRKLASRSDGDPGSGARGARGTCGGRPHRGPRAALTAARPRPTRTPPPPPPSASRQRRMLVRLEHAEASAARCKFEPPRWCERRAGRRRTEGV